MAIVKTVTSLASVTIVTVFTVTIWEIYGCDHISRSLFLVNSEVADKGFDYDTET